MSAVVLREADNRGQMGGRMLQRFVSASFVASIGIACAAVGLLAAKHIWTLHDIHQIAMIWCCVPLVWGVWAMLTPRTWVPERLPLWGAILGLAAGVNVLFVLNMPQVLLGQYIGVMYRVFGVVMAAVGYYLLWMIVRVVYRALRAPAEVKTFKTAA